MPKRRKRRRFRLPGTDTPGWSSPPMTPEMEFFALLDARDKVRAALARLKEDGAKTSAVALTRALALEAARGTVPDRFVQAMRQLQTLAHQHRERIEALVEFNRRFHELVKTTKAQHPAELEAALTARVKQLEEQKQLPGARVEEIEVQMVRWRKELGDLKPSSAARTKSKSLRPLKA